MTEYIKREDAIKWNPESKDKREYVAFNLDDAYETGYEDKIKQIEQIPAADVRENVRGKWIKDEYGYLVCSECENEMPTLWSQGRIPKWTVRYCYYCGAEMREVQDG